MIDPHKAPAVLATELGAQLINGNKRLVATTLMALPQPTAMLTVFFMRSNFQSKGGGEVGALCRVLSSIIDGAYD